MSQAEPSRTRKEFLCFPPFFSGFPRRKGPRRPASVCLAECPASGPGLQGALGLPLHILPAPGTLARPYSRNGEYILSGGTAVFSGGLQLGRGKPRFPIEVKSEVAAGRLVGCHSSRGGGMSCMRTGRVLRNATEMKRGVLEPEPGVVIRILELPNTLFGAYRVLPNSTRFGR